MTETAWVDVDSIAESLYRAAGQDPVEGTRPIELASALGLRVIVGHAMSLPGLASLCRVNGQWTIYLRGRASELREDWGIAHELAEWTLNQEGYVREDRELVADAVAAAVIAPRPKFLRIRHQVGESPARLAHALGSTQSLALLRLGEVVGTPLALIAPHNVRIRGEPFGWPEHEHELRALVESPCRGLSKVTIRDARHRVGLRAR